MSDNSKKGNLMSRRAFFATLLKLIFSLIIVIRFLYLQLFFSSRYKSLADSNRMRLEVLPQARGLILDQHNNLLARNIPQYSLLLNSVFFDQAKQIIAYIEKLLNKSLQMIVKDFQKIRKLAIKYRIPLILIPSLTRDEITLLECDLYLGNKIDIVANYRRQYLSPLAFAHILGYIAKPSVEEVKAQAQHYAHSHIEIGKNGVEKIFDHTLQGTPALRRIEVDAQGRYVRQLEYIPGKPGSNLQLSVDIPMQEIAVKAMGERVGSVILLDIESGEVLIQYSSPGYNINEFITGINNQEWTNLLKDQELPLMNKSISATYPPGSTFKPVTALAMLNAGISPDDTVFCSGQYRLNDRVFHCWKSEGHGYVNLNRAMAQSCNVYFYIQGRKAGIANLYQACQQLGLGQRTGIELPSESCGLAPDPAWKLRRIKHKWLVGDTINASIGQGYMLVTPIQLAVMIARIASGRLVKPTIIKKRKRTNFELLSEVNTNSCSEASLNHIRKALYCVFNAEYGLNFHHRWLTKDSCMVGKTGSAQVISQRKITQGRHRSKEHALFIGYFPHKAPKYAISVVVEHGEWGALAAMPVALEVARKISVL